MSLPPRARSGGAATQAPHSLRRDEAAPRGQRALGDPQGRGSPARGSWERRGGRGEPSGLRGATGIHAPRPRPPANRPTWGRTDRRRGRPIGRRVANQRAPSAAAALIGRSRPAPGGGGAPFCSFLRGARGAPTPEPRAPSGEPGSGPPGSRWGAAGCADAPRGWPPPAHTGDRSAARRAACAGAEPGPARRGPAPGADPVPRPPRRRADGPLATSAGLLRCGQAGRAAPSRGSARDTAEGGRGTRGPHFAGPSRLQGDRPFLVPAGGVRVPGGAGRRVGQKPQPQPGQLGTPLSTPPSATALLSGLPLGWHQGPSEGQGSGLGQEVRSGLPSSQPTTFPLKHCPVGCGRTHLLKAARLQP